MRSLLLLFSLLVSTTALPFFWPAGWGDSELAEKPEMDEKPEMAEKPEIVEKPETTEKPEMVEKHETSEEPETAEEPGRIEKWHTLKMPCGVFGVAACPGGVNPFTTTTTTTTTEAPAGIFGLNVEIPLTEILLREGSIEAETLKLKPIALPCGVFPLPACPGNVNPSKEPEEATTKAPNRYWWAHGRKANVDLRWNKLKMPCGVLGAPACPGGVNE